MTTEDGFHHPPRKWATEGGGPLRIDSYAFGRIVVSGREFRRDVILWPRRLYPSWWRAVGHELCVADLEMVGVPPLLVVGTGASGRMRVRPEVHEWAEREDVRLVVGLTAEACEAFNKAVESEDVVAALHLTC
jgi:hypothetical protein